jgi:hypothetical protein
MARRRGSAPRIAGRGRTKQKDTPDYYAKSDSDIVYGETAHRRARQRAVRQWLVRLAVVLVLVIAWHFWGPTVVGAIRGKGQRAAGEVRGVGQQIQKGRDERSGANFDETAP